MSSVKASLHHTIELLSDEEALETLEFIQRLQQQKERSHTLRHLASDPAFHLPAEGSGGFGTVEALPGQGVPASRLLVEERR